MSLIRLPDSSDDISHMLRAIYDREYFFPVDRQPFSRVAGILRMATKYMIGHLRKEAIAYLKHDFGSTLFDWDKAMGPDVDFMIIYENGEWPKAIGLARQCGVSATLPFALAFAAVTPFSDVLELEDTIISKDDKITCTLGRERMRERHWESIFSYLKQSNEAIANSGACLNPVNCYAVRVELLRAIAGNPDLVWSLVPWDIFHALAGTNYALCVDFLNSCSRTHENGRWTVWEHLPSFFDLPSWQDTKTELRI